MQLLRRDEIGVIVNEHEKIIYLLLTERPEGAKMIITDDAIFIALEEGLLIANNPETSIEWRDSDVITGAYTFKKNHD